MSLNVKTGDNVVIIAGKDKGKTGKILSVNTAKGTVKVEGRNMVTRHVKPRGPQQPGGKNTEPGNIDVSNVQIICPSCNKATRVRAGEADGKKVRACTKCGASLDARLKTDKKKGKDAEKKPAKKTAKKKEEAVEEVKADEAVEAAEEVKEKKPAAKKKTVKESK